MARQEKDDMTQWTTLKKAADILGVSIRTIHRRIKSGQYATQRQNDGRVSVRLRQSDIPDAVTAQQKVVDRLESQAAETQRLAGTLATISEGQLADMRQALESAQGRETRYRRSSLAGWSLVACMAIAGGIGVMYGIGQVTEAQSLVGVYEAQNADTASRLAETASDLEATRLSLSESEASREAAEVASSAIAERARITQQEVESLRAEIDCLEAEQRSQYLAGLRDGIVGSVGQNDQALAAVNE